MQDLSLLSKQELLNHAIKLSAEDQRISLLLVECLRECKRRMLFAELGYSSLWEFAVRYLGLSEGSSQLRVSAMRLARDIPKVLDSFQTGELSLSNASQLYSFFQAEKKEGKSYSPQSKEEVVQGRIGLSKKECERKLVALSPEFPPKYKERIVSETKIELKLILDHSTLEKLQKIKELLAYTLPQATHGQVIAHLIDKTLARLEKKKCGVKPDKNTLNSPHPEMALISININPDNLTTNKGDPMEAEAKEEISGTENKAPTRRTYISVSDRRWTWNRA